MTNNQHVMSIKVINVVGARPNFMKVAPLHRAFLDNGAFESLIVHTGQHYDARMSDVFFEQLELPRPDVYLGVGSGSHADQTAKIMVEFEKTVEEHRPDLILVVGDVNSTMACAIVGAKSHIPVAHVEAGLRSGDRRMPEEINRLITDSISDYLFVTERSGHENLKAEGIPDEKIFFVGNVMIDSLVHFREKAGRTTIMEDLSVSHRNYVLVTMHRPSNVDTRESLLLVVETVRRLSELMPVVMPMHPRTKVRLEAFGMLEQMEAEAGVLITEPLGYLEFLRLMDLAAAIVTDSGGVQEESTYLRVPCITLRENTERPVTIELGTNELLELNPGRILDRVKSIISEESPKGEIPPLWDGKAAVRIAEALEKICG